jgi:hypothetical protein
MWIEFMRAYQKRPFHTRIKKKLNRAYMNYKYNNVSAGYAGKFCINATLNSKYYNLLFEALNQSLKLLYFRNEYQGKDFS